jgi:hypothetical protein
VQALILSSDLLNRKLCPWQIAFRLSNPGSTGCWHVAPRRSGSDAHHSLSHLTGLCIRADILSLMFSVLPVHGARYELGMYRVSVYERLGLSVHFSWTKVSNILVDASSKSASPNCRPLRLGAPFHSLLSSDLSAFGFHFDSSGQELEFGFQWD